MMDTKTKSALENDLRYALEVMEEYSHLGLDNETASKLRAILTRQIDEAHASVSCSPAAPVRFPLSAETYA